MMSTPQYSESAQPLATPTSTRLGNGLGVAALVLGVASLVAVVSFILFPLGLLGGLVAMVLGGVAAARGRTKGAANPGQAVAGIVCGALALVIGCGVRGPLRDLRSTQHQCLYYLRQLHRKGGQPQRSLQLYRPPRERHPALGLSRPGRPVGSRGNRADHPIQRGADSPWQGPP